MSYPRSLAYFCNYLSGYSRNTLQIYPATPQTAVRSGSIIKVLLPQNTIVDLRTFTFNFLGQTTASAGHSGFPRHIETLFDSVSIEINGEVVTPATVNNNMVFKLLADYHMQDRANARSLLQNGLTTYVDGTDMQATGRQFSVDNWLGFLGTALPECIDTSMLGDVYVVIRLATNNVLALDATAISGNAAVDYQLSDLTFNVDAISFDDGALYYNFVNELLSRQNLEVPFQYWVSFSSGPVALPATLTGTLNTQSLDMLIGTVTPSALTGAVNATTSNVDYFTRGSANIQSVRTYVNNIAYPQFDMAPYQSFKQTVKALNLNQDVLGQFDSGITYGGSNNPIVNWQNNFFAHATRFNHPVPSDERYVSGINTRGTQASIRFQVNGTGATVVPWMFAQCTGVLKVGAYRSISVER